MAKRYLIVSDIHLCDVENHRDGWKAYKSSRFLFDEEFARLVEDFVSAAAEDEEKRKDEEDVSAPLTLVLNGDIIDFDLVVRTPEKDPPWPVSGTERHRGLDATPEKSAWKLEQVLDDHGTFLACLARFIAGGNRVVYVVGNHDTEFVFPEVQQVLRQRLERRVEREGGEITEENLRFEPWFYYVPGEIYAEHGHQYDYYSSQKYILDPTFEEGGERQLVLPMGNLSNRYMMSRMGYFNPHASDFILNVFRYFTHWLRYYAFSRRNLVFAWFFGSLAVMRRLIGVRRIFRGAPDGYEEKLDAMANRLGIGRRALEELESLQRSPITNRFFRIMREFWIDRLIIGLLMAVGTVALALVPIPLWVKLMVPLSSFPLIFFLYEYAAKGDTIFTVDKEVPGYARQITKILPVQVVAFGHTHKPRLIPLHKGAQFVDTGTWAPIIGKKEKEKNKLAQGYRNYLSITVRKGRAEAVYASYMSAER